MAFENNTSAVSLWSTMRRHARGFGSRNLGFEGTESPAEVFGPRLRYDNIVLLIPLLGMLPLPTIFRDVSGREMAIIRRHMPERMPRNQKIHRQPAFSASTPPKTGPMLGAVFGLSLSNSVWIHSYRRNEKSQVIQTRKVQLQCICHVCEEEQYPPRR